MLEGFGFHPVMINWIREMITTPSYSIALNGDTTGFFRGKEEFAKGILLPIHANHGGFFDALQTLH
jgi:hypothetical protein